MFHCKSFEDVFQLTFIESKQLLVNYINIRRGNGRILEKSTISNYFLYAIRVNFIQAFIAFLLSSSSYTISILVLIIYGNGIVITSGSRITNTQVDEAPERAKSLQGLVPFWPFSYRWIAQYKRSLCHSYI